MGGICFDSEEQMANYIEANSSSYDYVRPTIVDKTIESSYLNNLLFKVEYCLEREISIDYYSEKNDENKVKEIIDYLKLNYYKLYYDKDNNKIEDIFFYNMNYRNKYFSTWKNREKIMYIRHALSKTSIFKDYKYKKEHKANCLSMFLDLEKKDSLIKHVNGFLEIKPIFTNYNAESPIIKLLIYASLNTKHEHEHGQDDERGYSWISSKYTSIKFITKDTYSDYNSFRILKEIIKGKISLLSAHEDFDISYLDRLAEVEEYLFLNKDISHNAEVVNPTIKRTEDNIEIKTNLYNLFFSFKDSILHISSDYASCRIINIHRVSDNEKCLRTYLSIHSTQETDKLTIKFDTDLMFNPLYWDSGLGPLRKQAYLENN